MKKNFEYVNYSKQTLTLERNETLSKTYTLLSSTILFSAFTALLSTKYNFQVNYLLLIFNFLLLFVIEIFKKNIIGLFLVFIFTGILGFALGPIINSVLKIRYGEEILLFSLLSTGMIFMSTSLYILVTKKNLEFLSGFLLTGFILIFLGIVFNIFFNITLLNLIISSMIIILSTISIMYTTSNLINNNNIHYISATISIYLDIYNIFISMLNILRFISNRN